VLNGVEGAEFGKSRGPGGEGAGKRFGNDFKDRSWTNRTSLSGPAAGRTDPGALMIPVAR